MPKVPVSTYAAETRQRLTKHLEGKLTQAQRETERWMTGVAHRGRKRASMHIEEQTLVEAQLKKRMLSGHALGRTGDQGDRVTRRSGKRPFSRWRGERRRFGCKGWTRVSEDKKGRRNLGEAFIVQRPQLGPKISQCIQTRMEGKRDTTKQYFSKLPCQLSQESKLGERTDGDNDFSFIPPFPVFGLQRFEPH